MNTKIANVIAIELGLLIAITAWLAFYGFPVEKPPGVVARQELPADSRPRVSPVPEARSRRIDAVVAEVDRVATEQPEQEFAQPQTVPEYEEQVPIEPYGDAEVQEAPIIGASQYYAPIAQEPVIASPDCFVAPPVEIVEFHAAPQIIIYSSSRVIRPRRCPPPPATGGQTTVVSHQPDTGGPPTRGGEARPRQNPGPRLGSVMPRPNVNPPTSRPRQLAVNQQKNR